MSFIVNEARERMYRAAGLFSQTPASGALNLKDAAAAGFLYVELLVYDSSTFFPGQTTAQIEDALADVVTWAGLLAVAGLNVHQGANYSRKSVTSVSAVKVNAENHIQISTSPSTWVWTALSTEPNGDPLRYVALVFDDGSTSYPIALDDQGNIIGAVSNGVDNFSVSISKWWNDKHRAVEAV